MSNPSNVVQINDPVLPVSQNLYEQSTTAQGKVGYRLQVGDRTFYYARISTSANVSAGDCLCSTQSIDSHQAGLVTIAAATTGDKFITITAGSAISVNAYAEGYISIADVTSAGGGQFFRVKNHLAIGSGDTNGVINLYDAIPGTMDAGPASLTPNMFKDVQVGSVALDRAVGVIGIAATTGNYVWLQTWGPGSPKHSAATPAGAAISLATLGRVGAFSITGTQAATGFNPVDFNTIIGKNINLAATATECSPVILTILP